MAAASRFACITAKAAKRLERLTWDSTGSDTLKSTCTLAGGTASEVWEPGQGKLVSSTLWLYSRVLLVFSCRRSVKLVSVLYASLHWTPTGICVGFPQLHGSITSRSTSSRTHHLAEWDVPGRDVDGRRAWLQDRCGR